KPAGRSSDGGAGQGQVAETPKSAAQLKLLHQGHLRNAADLLQSFAPDEHGLIPHDSLEQEKADRTSQPRSGHEQMLLTKRLPESSRHHGLVAQAAEQRLSGVRR